MNTSEVRAFFEQTDVYLTYNYNLRIRAETVADFIAGKRFENVLDMPCGTGDISAPFIDQFDRLTLMDFSSNMIATARKRFKPEDEPKLRFVHTDFYEFPFGDEQFDLVMNIGILAHIQDPFFFLQETVKLVKSGGYLIIQNTDSNHWFAKLIDHWVHHPKMGGGRILGEVCHFVDLCAFLANSKVKSVSAHVFEIKPQHSDTFTATLQFENGSVANIAYFSNGNSSVGKERLEVFGGGLTAIIDDFKILEVFGKKHHVKRGKQDKGHTEEMRLVAEALKQGSPLPVSTQESLDSTLATFALQASLLAGGESVEPENYLRQWKSTAEN